VVVASPLVPRSLVGSSWVREVVDWGDDKVNDPGESSPCLQLFIAQADVINCFYQVMLPNWLLHLLRAGLVT